MIKGNEVWEIMKRLLPSTLLFCFFCIFLISCKSFQNIHPKAKTYISKSRITDKNSWGFKLGDSMKDGIWLVFYDNDSLAIRSEYKSKQRSGVWSWYYRNGQKFMVQEFEKDKPIGNSSMFYENGNIYNKDEDCDSFWRETYYYPNGNKLSVSNYAKALIKGSRKTEDSLRRNSTYLLLESPDTSYTKFPSHDQFRNNNIGSEIIYFENGRKRIERIWCNCPADVILDTLTFHNCSRFYTAAYWSGGYCYKPAFVHKDALDVFTGGLNNLWDTSGNQIVKIEPSETRNTIWYNEYFNNGNLKVRGKLRFTKGIEAGYTYYGWCTNIGGMVLLHGRW